MVRLNLRLPVSREAAATARHCIGALDGVMDDHVLENVTLLVSELVTNAVRHGHLGSNDWVDVLVEAEGAVVRVDVGDPGPGFRPPDEVRPFDDHGWGLYLVSRIAERWGVDAEDSRTDVWFEISQTEEPAF